jgi:SAM-dependent methyltransferase
MNEIEKQDVIVRYAERIRNFGPIVKALGWRDVNQQKLRFKILIECMEIEDKSSILDIGCGFGDLLNYLLEKKYNVDYCGCDLSPDVIKIASKNHKDINFLQKDILIDKFPSHSFDYVVMSGLFNYRITDNLKYLKSMVEESFKIARKGISFNLTTNNVDYMDRKLYYYDPMEIFNFCKIFTNKIVIRHDYPLYEFTVCLKK